MSFFYLPPEQHFPSSATYPCALTSIAFVALASHVWGTFKPSFSLFITIFHSHAHENVSINELVDIGKHFKCSWEKKETCICLFVVFRVSQENTSQLH